MEAAFGVEPGHTVDRLGHERSQHQCQGPGQPGLGQHPSGCPGVRRRHHLCRDRVPGQAPLGIPAEPRHCQLRHPWHQGGRHGVSDLPTQLPATHSRARSRRSGRLLMSNARHVVLVDTYAAIGTELAQGFRSAGYTPLRVQSGPEVPIALRGQPDQYPYEVDIVHHGDLPETLAALTPFQPVAVVAGTEPGVELADALSEGLHPITGAPTNGTALSPARRDKYQMIERIKEQGLRGARQILVADEVQLRNWHNEIGGMIVLKPLRSAGNDGVTWCR